MRRYPPGLTGLTLEERVALFVTREAERWCGRLDDFGTGDDRVDDRPF